LGFQVKVLSPALAFAALLLAASLGPPRPAASAGPAASPTPLPYAIYFPYVARGNVSAALAKPPAGSTGISYVNYYRATAYLPPVAENATWSQGDWLHARYATKNDVLQHSEDPSNPWYTTDGDAAARASNQIGSWDTAASDEWAVDTWMQAAFHAVGILDPALLQVGYGSYREVNGGLQMAAGLDVIRGLGAVPPSVELPVRWPGNEITVPLTRHILEAPDPLTSCPGYTVPAGLPVLLIMGGGDPPPSVGSHSFSDSSGALEHCLFDGTTYVNPDSALQSLGRSILRARNAIVLVPRAPLTPGGSYTASINVNGHDYTWSFHIAGGVVSVEAGAPAATDSSVAGAGMLLAPAP